MNRRAIGLPLLGWIFFVLAVIPGVSCRKAKTYTVQIKDGVRTVHNIKPSSEEPVAALAFVGKIGELEATDPEYQFARPMGTAEDDQGNLFILDDKDGVIRKFGPDRKFRLKFGRKGQGPGEMLYPMWMCAAADGRLIVSTMSSDFHIFDNGGAFVDRFRLPAYRGLSPGPLGSDRIVTYAFQNRGENNKENRILAVFDFQGQVRHEFGEPFLLETAQKSWNANFLHLTTDRDENIYVSFSSLNRIEKYSSAGKLLMSIDRELPFEVSHRYGKSSMDIGGKSVSIDQPEFTPVSRGIGIDAGGRIWVLSVRKALSRAAVPKDYDPRPDLAFEVYSPDGVLLSRLPFPREVAKFDNMTMHGDHIFFVDPFDQACVHEYALAEKND